MKALLFAHILCTLILAYTCRGCIGHRTLIAFFTIGLIPFLQGPLFWLSLAVGASAALAAARSEWRELSQSSPATHVPVLQYRGGQQ